jgi:flagellum-specific ATP synthase
MKAVQLTQTLRTPEVLAERLRQFLMSSSRTHGLVKITGRLSAIDAVGISVKGLSRHARLGDFLKISSPGMSLLAETVAIAPDKLMAKPLSNQVTVPIGAEVCLVGPLTCRPDRQWKGRVISALALPIDGGQALPQGAEELTYDNSLVEVPVKTGVKAIDVFLPLCFGQRVGVFAGSGVGKSTLMSMLARARGFDTVVVALVGERGREVREFVEETLGDALQRCVVVVATSDEPASMRRLAPLLATTIAEYFRNRGDKVLLMMDSITRYAHALREIGLAAGEPPVARGYPPSVFGALPLLLERSGPGAKGSGSITGIYSVLVDGDNHNEPVSDAVRGTLDGHIVLDREIAASGRFPAIDVLESVSRLALKAWTSEQVQRARELKRLISRYEESRDLRAIGSYVAGGDPELDRAVSYIPRLYQALQQTPRDAACDDAFAVLPTLPSIPAAREQTTRQGKPRAE